MLALACVADGRLEGFWQPRIKSWDVCAGLVLAAEAGAVVDDFFAGEGPARQAACFAAFHLLPERMPQTFALGVLLGWLTLRSGSILPAILAHLVHNSVPLVLYALAGGTASRLDATPAGLPAAAIVGAVACLAAGLAVAWAATRGAGSAAAD